MLLKRASASWHTRSIQHHCEREFTSLLLSATTTLRMRMQASLRFAMQLISLAEPSDAFGIER